MSNFLKLKRVKSENIVQDDNRLDVSFADQAWANEEAMRAMEKIEGKAQLKLLMVSCIESSITATRLAKENGVDTTKPSMIEYNAYAYQTNMNDCLSIKTETIHQTMCNLHSRGILPENLQSKIDEFDITKITIAPYDDSALHDLPEEKKQAVLYLQSVVQNAKGKFLKQRIKLSAHPSN